MTYHSPNAIFSVIQSKMQILFKCYKLYFSFEKQRKKPTRTHKNNNFKMRIEQRCINDSIYSHRLFNFAFSFRSFILSFIYFFPFESFTTFSNLLNFQNNFFSLLPIWFLFVTQLLRISNARTNTRAQNEAQSSNCIM